MQTHIYYNIKQVLFQMFFDEFSACTKNICCCNITEDIQAYIAVKEPYEPLERGGLTYGRITEERCRLRQRDDL